MTPGTRPLSLSPAVVHALTRPSCALCASLRGCTIPALGALCRQPCGVCGAVAGAHRWAHPHGGLAQPCAGWQAREGAGHGVLLGVNHVAMTGVMPAVVP